ncbi:Mitochondrial import inner membrane translocase subunit tim21 [Hypsizygus marmoreus]|uniref:Mitochondrial import inner membrane translocase subunit Tim21 n=1 Tax=Hypsizygus marmoreus TaxID=39966 RepID=A0A369K9Y9_HYPMA|nr:Mitochondrial import inner membrane translocase subunit tim21 [Hypsizygus marmoreus]
MNIANLLFRTECSTVLSRSLSKHHRAFLPVSKRKYATHRDAESSSLLSQSLDTRQRAVPTRDSVGPFQLGLAQSSLKRGEKVKKWSELSTGGKVMRTTVRTTNLTVILLGAGLSALLIYSLTSELFSKNSPTVLYGDACERIKASPKVAKYLNGSLSFHNNPPSAVRPRHRNRHVISQIMVDAYGQEHMIMTFYVQGRPPGSDSSHSESSYLGTASEWVQDKVSGLSELTLDESITWTQEHAHDVWERTKRLFKYLSGAPEPVTPLPPYPSTTAEKPKSEEQSAWSFTGMFSALKRSKGGHTEPKQGPDGRVFTDGQVHADFIRNNEGYFVFRYLLIDIPSSRDPNPVRVFVERAPGVRDNEPVMRWNTS